MLVSHQYRFIYTKTKKTGGTSVESYFERYCMPPNEWESLHARDEHVSPFGIVGYRGPSPPAGVRYWNHMPAALIREKVGQEIWDSYLKFCVIRNPYEKVVSAFYFYRAVTTGSSETTSLDIERDREDFEAWLPNYTGFAADTETYLIDGNVTVDAIIRYESLATDLAAMCSRLGIPWQPEQLPKFKAGIRPQNASSNELYTEKTRSIVESVHKFELDYFNYEFPSEHPTIVAFPSLTTFSAKQTLKKAA